MNALLPTTDRLITSFEAIISACVNLSIGRMTMPDIAVDLHRNTFCVRFMQRYQHNLFRRLFEIREGDLGEQAPSEQVPERIASAAASPVMSPRVATALPSELPSEGSRHLAEGVRLITNMTFTCPNINLPFGEAITNEERAAALGRQSAEEVLVTTMAAIHMQTPLRRNDG